MKNLFFALLFSAIIAGSGCTTHKRIIQTELYFGLSRSNGNIISDSAWNGFVQQHVSKTFPHGFTIVNTEGRWMDEANKNLYAEPSRIIISIHEKNRNISSNIDSLIIIYKKLFQQQSVLRVDKKVSADF